MDLSSASGCRIKYQCGCSQNVFHTQLHYFWHYSCIIPVSGGSFVTAGSWVQCSLCPHKVTAAPSLGGVTSASGQSPIRDFPNILWLRIPSFHWEIPCSRGGIQHSCLALRIHDLGVWGLGHNHHHWTSKEGPGLSTVLLTRPHPSLWQDCNHCLIRTGFKPLFVYSLHLLSSLYWIATLTWNLSQGVSVGLIPALLVYLQTSTGSHTGERRGEKSWIFVQ